MVCWRTPLSGTFGVSGSIFFSFSFVALFGMNGTYGMVRSDIIVSSPIIIIATRHPVIHHIVAVVVVVLFRSSSWLLLSSYHSSNISPTSFPLLSPLLSFAFFSSLLFSSPHLQLVLQYPANTIPTTVFFFWGGGPFSSSEFRDVYHSVHFYFIFIKTNKQTNPKSRERHGQQTGAQVTDSTAAQNRTQRKRSSRKQKRFLFTQTTSTINILQLYRQSSSAPRRIRISYRTVVGVLCLFCSVLFCLVARSRHHHIKKSFFFLFTFRYSITHHVVVIYSDLFSNTMHNTW